MCGEVWRPLPLGFVPAALYSLDFRRDTMEGFVFGAEGTLLQTDDGGETWERLDPGTDADLFSVRFFADGRNGIIAGDERTLIFTTDAGQTWTPSRIL